MPWHRRVPPIPIETYRVNNQIRIREVRLIGADGAQLGVVATDEARRMADEAGLDLVEVAPNARPPVCRIMDFGKFKYRQKKSAQKSRHHLSQLKEIRVRPKIGEHDLRFKLDRARGFLEQGDKVQVNLLFRGREMIHQEVAHALLRRIAEALSEVAKIELTPRIEGRRLSMLLTKK